MRYLALAADYDGTLAMSRSLSVEIEGALERLRSSGRRVVLVTGRMFEEFAAACSSMALFDCVVLENGAVLYWPSRRQLTALCPPAAPELVRELARRGVEPVIKGQAIVRPDGQTRSRSSRRSATWAWSFKSSLTATRSWCCPPA